MLDLAERTAHCDAANRHWSIQFHDEKAPSRAGGQSRAEQKEITMLDLLKDDFARRGHDQPSDLLDPTRTEPLAEAQTTASGAPADALTEEEAICWIRERLPLTTTVRELESEWCWPKSSVSRFLSRINGTHFHIISDKSGTRIGPLAASGEAGSRLSDLAAPNNTNWSDVAADNGSNEFSWLTAEKEGELVQRSTRAIAAYINPHGMIVIRGEADWNDEDDPIVIVAPSNLMRLVNRLIELGDELKFENDGEE
jgi:hypothetical protein